MKRLLLTALLVSAFVLALAMPALAQGDLALYIDNQQVATEPQLYNYGDAERASKYFMDVAPQIRENRAYVPPRTISLFLGAEIHWQSPEVLLNYGETALALTPGSKRALKNGAEWDLDAAPYIKNNRTMVPLRFVAEAFGCKVGYANGKVYVNTEPLRINGAEVKALHQRIRMTMGGFINECQSNLCIKEMQRFLAANCGEEIPAPAHFGEIVLVDPPDYYYMMAEWSFLNQAGHDTGADLLQQYKIYARNSSDELLEEIGFSGIHYGFWLIHDVTANQWHKLITDQYYLDVQEISGLGLWEQIFNNVV